ncbi:MAG: EAL domain-containing protein [Terracidiphilus sp.]|jgi:EAL and modified HD-GYP domain-containing signal transduction protein
MNLKSLETSAGPIASGVTSRAALGATSGVAVSASHIARQPILDAKGGLFGYELLFRSGGEDRFFDDGNLATRIMLDSTVVFGVDQLSSGYPVFVNCTRESLLGGLVQVLNPQNAVLEILENIVLDERMIQACRDLHAKGYRLALDDFVWSPAIAPLVELADFIKIDALSESADERRRLVGMVRHTGAQLIAERVETQEVFETLKAEGFTLFQGYYFCRPVRSSLVRSPSNMQVYLELLAVVQRSPVDIHAASHLLRRDASLAYRLLRLVNSPLYAVRGEISSLEQALLIVGEELFRHLVVLAISGAAAGSQNSALLRLALHRTRFCELASKLWQLDSDEQGLVGLVSLLPAILKAKMESIAEILPMRPAIREALLGADVIERGPLSWLECFESGDWEGCASVEEKFGIPEPELARFYNEAIQWADEAAGRIG